MNLEAILSALLAIAPQIFNFIQQKNSGVTVTDAQVQALFTTYGVEEGVAAQLVSTMQAAGK